MIKTLSNLDKKVLVEAINLGFSDYITPIHMDEISLETKIITAQIDLNSSVGFFDETVLVGFILVGIDGSFAYNAMTAIIPSHRSKGLFSKMYVEVEALLQAKGINSFELEAISTNSPAINAYERMGFEIDYTLDCYRKIEDYDVNYQSDVDVDTPILFPSFQNRLAMNTLEKSEQEDLDVYSNNTIQQIFSRGGYKGLSTLASNLDIDTKLINVLHNSSVEKVLTENGFQIFISQVHMTKYIGYNDKCVFRKAKLEDVDAIMDIIGEAVIAFRKQAIDQWQKGYPDKQRILDDIKEGNAYVLIDGDVVAYTYLGYGVEQNYDQIEQGTWKNEDLYAVMHRFVVSNTKQGKGYATKLYQGCENVATVFGISEMRIDTHEVNIKMRNFVEKQGFEFCGIVEVADGIRVAYQKSLKSK
ncbi:MAG: GNAT family N-acetyltransferase [Erysipelothrix sp.]